jgi:hypothetical protein
MKFAIDSNSSSLLELLHTAKDCIQKDMNSKKWKQVSLLDLWKKSQTNKLRGLSPRTNYTDRATAACRRS